MPLPARVFRPFVAVLTPLIALWMLENWVGERRGATALLLYFPQHLWGLYPLAFLASGFSKKRRSHLIPGGLGVMFWLVFLLGFRFSSTRVASKAPTIRLMTYNIERGARGTKALENAIRAQNPDIVCLQESQGMQGTQAFAPGAQIAARFAGWNMAKAGDVMTLSHFPITSRRDYPLRGTRRILETTLGTPRGSVRVLNVHISTSLTGQSSHKRGKIGRLLQVASHARPSAQARMEQIAPLQKAIRADDSLTPLLVAGDFNSPPRGLFYGAISRDLADAWQSAGRGTGNTFPARLPLLPIDHVLTRGIQVKRAFVSDARASDHRPLVVDW